MSNVEGMPSGQRPPLAGDMAVDDLSKAWYDAEAPKPVDQVTVTEFEQLCEALYADRAKYDLLKEQAKAQNERVERLEAQVLSYLKAMNRSNYKSKLGTISKIEKRSWKLPAAEADRSAFFAALKAEGVFEGMISVNFNTMNSFMQEKFEKAEAEGRAAGFSYPGIGEPAVYDQIRVLKGK